MTVSVTVKLDSLVFTPRCRAGRIPAQVSADRAYQNARQNSDKANARIEHDKGLGRVITTLLRDDTELFDQSSDNPSLKRRLADTIFAFT